MPASIRKIGQIGVLVFFLVLSACAPAITPPPEGMLETMIAATVQALPTNTPLPAPVGTVTLRPTRLPPTEIFTPTPGVSITPFPTFTLTPTITETATEVGVAARQGVYQGSGNYACMVMSQKPINWTKFAPNTLVYATWTVKNVGAKEWKSSTVQIAYEDGEKIYEYAPKQDFPFVVKPGETRDIVIVVRAPEEGGDYHSTFGLQRSGDFFCRLIIAVSVR